MVLSGTFAVLAMLIALVGLGRLHPDLELARVPAWFWYFRADPEVRRWLGVGALASGLLEVVVLGAFAANLRRPLHGAARWASEAEIERGGLRSETGIVLGQLGGRLLTFGGDEHVMLYAPTRTGKGVGIVIPNLLTWPGALLVLDVKRENWAASAGFRARCGQQVFLFDPLAADRRTARFNPLGHIDRENRARTIDQLQSLAVMLFPDGRHGEAFWSEAARVGFLGVAAYVAETQELPMTLGEVYRQMTTGDPRSRFPEEIERRARSARPLSSACVAALSDFCSASDRTFASVRQTITSRMGLFLNPRVDAATSASDFDLSSLREGKTSIYLCAAPEDLVRIAPLYALLLQLFLDASTRSMLPAPGAPAKVLLVLDEFARLGPMSQFAQAFSFIAGYGIRLLCVLQSPAQLRASYGPDTAEDILSNCAVEAAFAPTDIRLAETLSQRLGTYGHPSRSHSRPVGLGAGRHAITTSEQARPLLLPQELLQMSRRELLVLRAGMRPIRARKLRYFEMLAFRRRVLPPPEVRPYPEPCGSPAQPQSLSQSLRRFEDADDVEAASEQPDFRAASEPAHGSQRTFTRWDR